MSRYRKVLTRLWEDDKFPFLSEDSQRLFIYHLTSPRSTPFLLYVEGAGSISDTLRMPAQRLKRAQRELSEHGMVRYADDGSNLVFLPNALRNPENAPVSNNEVKTWVAIFADLPKTGFFSRCVAHWAELARSGAVEKSLAVTFISEVKAYGKPNGMAKAMPKPTARVIQEQEQESEQEQEQEQERESPQSPPAGGEPPSHPATGLFAELWDAYPRQEGQVRAEQAFRKLKADRSLVTRMIAWIGEARLSEQWRDPEFIPFLARWLNERRWLDKPPPRPRESQPKLARESVAEHNARVLRELEEQEAKRAG